MRMARVNVYLPDDLAERARASGLNVSAVTQDALRAILAAASTDRWLDTLQPHTVQDVRHELVLRALDDARDDLGA